MRAEILSIGTEILLGDILNTNAQYLSEKLATMGINVYSQRVVGDNPKRLEEAFNYGFKDCDIIITSGGLGPTKDDLTKEIACKYFNKELIFDNNSWENILQMFSKRNITLTENNKRQAYFPKDSIIVKNNNGTAPACIIEENNKILIMLPGPPKELIPIFEESIIPYLRNKTNGVFISKIIRFSGIGESKMEDAVLDLIDKQTNPSIAPYAKDTECILRITASGKNELEAENIMKPIIKEIYNRLGEFIYGEDNAKVEEILIDLLKEKNMTLATAESCTGGMIASRIVNISGSSSVLMEGIVTYSNNSKIERIGVSKETLDKYGAVSKETAREMAIGVTKKLNCNCGISVTGIAGPTGGTKEKPVGLVYIGICINNLVKTKEMCYSGNRTKIRERATNDALHFLRSELLNINTNFV